MSDLGTTKHVHMMQSYNIHDSRTESKRARMSLHNTVQRAMAMEMAYLRTDRLPYVGQVEVPCVHVS